MASEKLNRKDLKKLDSFQERTLAYFEKLLKHKKWLYIVGVGLLVAVLLAGFGFTMYEKQQRKTAESLAAIDMQYNVEYQKFVDGIQVKMKPLQDKMRELQSKKDVDTKAVTEIQQKLQNIQMDYAQEKPEHKGSLEEYIAFFEQGSTNRHLAAGLQAVATLLETSENDKALGYLVKIQKKAKNQLFYKNQTADLLTSLYEQQKKYDLAVAQAQIMLKSKVDYYKQRGLISLGRIYSAKGDKEKAISYYDQFLKDYSDATAAATVKSLKAML